MSAKDVPQQPGILPRRVAAVCSLAKAPAGVIHAAQQKVPRDEENGANRGRAFRAGAGNPDRMGRDSARQGLELRIPRVLPRTQSARPAIQVRPIRSIHWQPILPPAC